MKPACHAGSRGCGSLDASSPGIACARIRVATIPGSNRLMRNRSWPDISSAQASTKFSIAALPAPSMPQKATGSRAWPSVRNTARPAGAARSSGAVVRISRHAAVTLTDKA